MTINIGFGGLELKISKLNRFEYLRITSLWTYMSKVWDQNDLKKQIFDSENPILTYSTSTCVNFNILYFSPLWTNVDGGWYQNNLKNAILNSTNFNFDIFDAFKGSF